MIIADLRVYSKFSGGKLTIPQLVDFYGMRGFGCIAITDRINEQTGLFAQVTNNFVPSVTPATFPIYMAILKSEAERAWDRYRMLVIPGFQLSRFSLGVGGTFKIVALGATEYVHFTHDVVQAARAVRNQNALAIAAAPITMQFRERAGLWHHREKLVSEFDAWEFAWGRKFHSEIKTSGLPVVACSAFSRPHQINSWKTIFNCERHPEAVLEAIRRQNLEFKFYKELANVSPRAYPPSLGDGAHLVDFSPRL